MLWRREAEVIQLIEYFDRPEKKDNWLSLSHKEVQVILKEIERCRKDFAYAARNYFWITTKSGEDIPFKLWESQEIILDKWTWLKMKYPDKAQRIMILKGRQIGASTVIEGLIAWATIFFSNRSAIVVSATDDHAAYLFGIMQHILDHLPWWMQPMVASRKFETGLWFDNPDETQRRDKPGNNSKIVVQSASQTSGVGQGRMINACHVSEYADFEWAKFNEIISGDLGHAIADNGNSFAFLESTGKGSGSPAEAMWLAQVDLAEEAEWVPLFIPWFFEKTRFIPPESGWMPQQPEMDMREKISRDWVRCDNEKCGHYYESTFRRESRVGIVCPECKVGTLQDLTLTDGQLRFMQNRRHNADKKGADALKKLKEELASTAEEAFQLSGIQVFPPDTQDFVNVCSDPNPLIWGNIDNKGNLHWVKDVNTGKCGCDGCPIDHRWDPEHPLQIWELPIPGCSYSIGVDVAEGLQGKADFSVIFINKVSPNGRYPDEQVAMWRSNSVDPIQFASPINALGRMYNDALVSIEVNKFDSCFNTVRLQYLYPNLFIWKHYDSRNPLSNKLGWVTNLRSKPMLWQTAVRWLRARMWIVKTPLFLLEMKKFQKDEYDDQVASAEKNYHDDVLMAGLIALFCAHDMDYSEDMSFIPVRSQERVASAEFLNTCMNSRCGFQFETVDYPASKCARCGSMLISAHRQAGDGGGPQVDWNEMSYSNADE